MPATIGFDHYNYSVAGLVQQFLPGPWETAEQFSSAFGVHGSSVINGGLRRRPISIAMMIFGANSLAQRDGTLMQLELKIGTVGGLTVTAGYATLANIPANVRLAHIAWGRPGVDPWNGYFRQMFFEFEQLTPPPAG